MFCLFAGPPVFPLRMVLMMLPPLLMSLYIPPPKEVTVLPAKVLLMIEGLPVRLYIPPPFPAELLLKMQVLMLGLEEMLYIPPA